VRSRQHVKVDQFSRIKERKKSKRYHLKHLKKIIIIFFFLYSSKQLAEKDVADLTEDEIAAAAAAERQNDNDSKEENHKNDDDGGDESQSSRSTGNVDARASAVSVRVAVFNSTAAAKNHSAHLSESGAEHQLRVASFGSVTRCHLCSEVIWGLVNQGLQCVDCNLVLHHRCKGALQQQFPLCPRANASSQLRDHVVVARHYLLVESTLSDVACHGCNAYVGGLSVHRCQLCRATCHDKPACKAALQLLACRAWGVRDGAELPERPRHHFLAAPCTGVCVACGKRAKGVGTHFVVHCVVCNVVLHAECRATWADPTGCSLGALRDVVLPPHTVTLLEQPDARARDFLTKHRGALLLFVNRRSGGGQGAALYAQMLRAGVSPLQIYDLANGGPVQGLRNLVRVPGVRILVCGGDGTAGWLLSELDKIYGVDGKLAPASDDNDNTNTDEYDDAASEGDDDDPDASATVSASASTGDGGKPKRRHRRHKQEKEHNHHHHHHHHRHHRRHHDDDGKPHERPALGMLPIGTGNDLARVTGWGGGYDGELVTPWLQAIMAADVRMLDRWSVSLAPAAVPDGDAGKSAGWPVGEFGASERKHTMNNYFSIGIDAAIALRFHRRREASPHLFTSRTVNKAWYGLIGAREAVVSSPAGTKLLKSLVKVIADGTELDLGDNQALVVLNLQSYSGGVDLWNDATNSAANDGKLELVGFTGPAHAAFVRGKMSGVNKLAQASHVVIRWLHGHELPCQVDGEPWSQAAAEIDIRFWNQAPLLVRAGFGRAFSRVPLPPPPAPPQPNEMQTMMTQIQHAFFLGLFFLVATAHGLPAPLRGLPPIGPPGGTTAC
jgi:diacylglycerol kinase family enzyme